MRRRAKAEGRRRDASSVITCRARQHSRTAPTPDSLGLKLDARTFTTTSPQRRRLQLHRAASPHSSLTQWLSGWLWVGHWASPCARRAALDPLCAPLPRRLCGRRRWLQRTPIRRTCECVFCWKPRVCMCTATDRTQFAPRDSQGKLKAAIVNPVDKYKEKGEALHKYGNYLMSCLPKYIQQYACLGIG